MPRLSTQQDLVRAPGDVVDAGCDGRNRRLRHADSRSSLTWSPPCRKLRPPRKPLVPGRYSPLCRPGSPPASPQVRFARRQGVAGAGGGSCRGGGSCCLLPCLPRAVRVCGCALRWHRRAARCRYRGAGVSGRDQEVRLERARRPSWRARSLPRGGAHSSGHPAGLQLSVGVEWTITRLVRRLIKRADDGSALELASLVEAATPDLAHDRRAPASSVLPLTHNANAPLPPDASQDLSSNAPGNELDQS